MPAPPAKSFTPRDAPTPNPEAVPGSVPGAGDAYNARLVEREELTDQHAILRVAFDDGAVPAFEPGQHTQLGLVVGPEDDEVAARKGRPRLARRTYTIASAPGDPSGGLEFYVLHVPDGRFSSRLWKLCPGDPLFVDPRPGGKLTLRDIPPDQDIVCVATGTGLAPFMSMLKAYRAPAPGGAPGGAPGSGSGGRGRGRGRWNRFVAIHGTRLAAELGYRGELERIAAEDPSVVYLPTVTREGSESEWSGFRGRVHALLEPDTFARLTGVALLPERCHVFLCGNPDMVDDCEADLVRRGFTPRDRHNRHGNLHFERYW